MLQRLAPAAFSNAYLLLTLTALLWAGNFVLGRGVAGHVPPIALSWCRWTFAFLILFPFATKQIQKDWPVIRTNLPILILLGTLGVGSFNMLAYTGLNYTTAINGAILQSSCPVLIAVIGFLVFREKLSWLQAFGITLSLTGVLTVIAQGDIDVLRSFALNRGDAWLFAAMIVWAIYTVFLRLRPKIHWLSFAATTFLVGAVIVTPFFIVEHVSSQQLKWDVETLLAILYVAIFPSVLAYIFFNRGVELIGANRGGVFMHLVPFFVTALAIIFLGENLRLFHVIGFVLILSGVWLAARKTEYL